MLGEQQEDMARDAGAHGNAGFSPFSFHLFLL